MLSDIDDLKRSLAIFMFKSDTAGRTRLWRKLGKQLKDGVPIIPAMNEQQSLRKKGDPMEMALGEWAAVMKNGKRFSDAVKDWVTTEESMLLMAGEQSGSLYTSMNSVVVVTKAKKDIQNAVVGGLAYPVFLLLLAFGMMYFFNYKIIPTFTQIVKGAAWTGMANTAVVVSNFVQAWFPVIAGGVVALIVAFAISLPIWNGSPRKVLDRYAPYSIYRVMQGSSWLIALSGLIQAGVRIDTALAQLAGQSSPWARERINSALRGLRAGRNLGEALAQSGYDFPDREIISDIRIYSSRSGLEDALRIIGDEWMVESVASIQKLMKVMFSLTMLLAASIMAFEMAGMMAMQLQLSQVMQH